MGTLTAALSVLVLLIGLVSAAPRMRFDQFALWGCPKEDPGRSQELSQTCDPAKRAAQGTDPKLCMCPRDLERLSEGGSHYITYSGNDVRYLDAITSSGNQMAWMVDNIATKLFKTGKSGKVIADALWKKANKLYGANVPKYWILNEISVKLWFRQKNKKYQKWVIELVTRIRAHKVIPITCSPSLRIDPRNYDKEWKRLAAAGYIGIEVYGIGSQLVKSQNYDVDWLTNIYKRGLASYAKAGVKKSRIIIVDHYGRTKLGKKFGSGGVAPVEWEQVIAARGAAVKRLGVAGTLSYGWPSYYNDTPQIREGFYDAYNAANK
jgi:hypothetical protein